MDHPVEQYHQPAAPRSPPPSIPIPPPATVLTRPSNTQPFLAGHEESMSHSPYAGPSTSPSPYIPGNTSTDQGHSHPHSHTECHGIMDHIHIKNPVHMLPDNIRTLTGTTVTAVNDSIRHSTWSGFPFFNRRQSESGGGGGGGNSGNRQTALMAAEELAASAGPRSIAQRILPTQQHAINEHAKYSDKAKWSSYALNGAIGLQVLLGALITGVAAAASPKGAQVSTSILGGASTLVASFLARARGSGEPETSRDRARDLDKWLRACGDFVLDWGFENPDPRNPSQLHQDLLKKVADLRVEYNHMIDLWNGEKSIKPAQDSGKPQPQAEKSNEKAGFQTQMPTKDSYFTKTV